MQPAARLAASLILGLPLLAMAQGTPRSEPWLLVPAAARGPLGLSADRIAVPIGCGASLLPCRGDAAALAARDPSSLRWSVQLAPVAPAATNRLASTTPRQGLNLSLMGRQPLFGSSFSVYGKLGTSTAWQDGPVSTSAVDGNYGLSFGGGVSWDFSPRLSATFGWESQELRLGAGSRDAVRATTLGLQYRY